MGREGEGLQLKNSGKLKVVLEKGRYANAQSLQANIDASYTPEGLDVPTIFFRSDKMDFQAIMQAKGSTLEISKIQVDQGQNKYASGYVSLPFIWKNIGTDKAVIAGDGKVIATFQSENLDLKKLFADVGAKPVASGLVNVKLEAHGTLSDLGATLDLQARELRSETFPKFEPATFDLNLSAQGNELTVNGKFAQSKIQPITLEAKLPFNAGKVLAEKTERSNPDHGQDRHAAQFGEFPAAIRARPGTTRWRCGAERECEWNDRRSSLQRLGRHDGEPRARNERDHSVAEQF